MSATAAKGLATPPLLRDAYPRHTAKSAARAADVPLETARNWTRGRTAPSAETLLMMADRCERMAAALERMIHDRRAARLRRQDAPTHRGLAAELGGAPLTTDRAPSPRFTAREGGGDAACPPAIPAAHPNPNRSA